MRIEKRGKQICFVYRKYIDVLGERGQHLGELRPLATFAMDPGSAAGIQGRAAHNCLELEFQSTRWSRLASAGAYTQTEHTQTGRHIYRHTYIHRSKK